MTHQQYQAQAQYLIDYTVRNLTTGDGEEVRVLELQTDLNAAGWTGVTIEVEE